MFVYNIFNPMQEKDWRSWKAAERNLLFKAGDSEWKERVWKFEKNVWTGNWLHEKYYYQFDVFEI